MKDHRPSRIAIKVFATIFLSIFFGFCVNVFLRNHGIVSSACSLIGLVVSGLLLWDLHFGSGRRML